MHNFLFYRLYNCIFALPSIKNCSFEIAALVTCLFNSAVNVESGVFVLQIPFFYFRVSIYSGLFYFLSYH